MRFGMLAGILVSASIRGPSPAEAAETAPKARWTMTKAKIVCQGKEFEGLRGTLRVPEDRGRPNSRLIELPILVVKSLSPTLDYPVFQCAGGPGGANVASEPRISQMDVQYRDVV